MRMFYVSEQEAIAVYIGGLRNVSMLVYPTFAEKQKNNMCLTINRIRLRGIVKA